MPALFFRRVVIDLRSLNDEKREFSSRKYLLRSI